MKLLSRYFINGLIVVVPVAITWLVIVQVFLVAENVIGRHLPVRFPGLGLAVFVCLIVAIGWMSSYWLPKKLLGFVERLLGSIPVVKFIYATVKKLSTAMLESPHLFKRAVLVPYPHQGCKALGFVMAELSAPLSEKTGEDMACVFIPMSLNMTAGFNIIVPKTDIIHLDISSESALEYIISAGMVMPEGNTAPNDQGRDAVSIPHYTV